MIRVPALGLLVLLGGCNTLIATQEPEIVYACEGGRYFGVNYDLQASSATVITDGYRTLLHGVPSTDGARRFSDGYTTLLARGPTATLESFGRTGPLSCSIASGPGQP